jgi:hypothetical protein
MGALSVLPCVRSQQAQWLLAKLRVIRRVEQHSDRGRSVASQTQPFDQPCLRVRRCDHPGTADLLRRDFSLAAQL